MYTVLQNGNNWLSYSGPNQSFLICKYILPSHTNKLPRISSEIIMEHLIIGPEEADALANHF